MDGMMIMQRLEDIETEIAEKQPRWEQASTDYARLTRDWDKRLALYAQRGLGDNAEMRKARALVQAIEHDELYEELTDAEARYNALKAAMRSLETRASIGQSLLKAGRP